MKGFTGLKPVGLTMRYQTKLAKNTKFWNGLKVQLPQYMKVDSCKKGIFLIIVYTDKDTERINDIQEISQETCRHHKVDIKIVVVDARVSNKESASKKNNVDINSNADSIHISPNDVMVAP